jgi:hypothetical protein
MTLSICSLLTQAAWGVCTKHSLQHLSTWRHVSQPTGLRTTGAWFLEQPSRLAV